MNENPSQEEMARISKRVFGRAGTKPCVNPDVIECRRYICQKSNRCMMAAKRRQKPNGAPKQHEA